MQWLISGEYCHMRRTMQWLISNHRTSLMQINCNGEHMKIIEDNGPGAAFYASAKAMTNGNHTFYVSKLIQRDDDPEIDKDVIKWPKKPVLLDTDLCEVDDCWHDTPLDGFSLNLYALVAHSSYCSVCLQILLVMVDSLAKLSMDVGDKDLVYSLLLVFSGMLMDEKGKECILDNIQITISVLSELVSYPHMM
ncbi:MMS19 nucleotide excision repair protein-like protein [Zea mays]|uniref:MMS19 nucleotide excision repair protein-like protein n=1 Tax=Zea mays TaxID=4577 RepID=A0A1D6EVV1_MAIZE|nr:MMS19 nucleotide excision repair protein-like protein [Zea mays]